MRNSRPISIPLGSVPPYYIAVMSKTFDRPKLDEDMEIGIRGLYQDNGYFKVVVKDPIIQNVTLNQGVLPKGVPLVGVHRAGRQTSRFPSKRASGTAWGRSTCAMRIQMKASFSRTRIWNRFSR